MRSTWKYHLRSTWRLTLVGELIFLLGVVGSTAWGGERAIDGVGIFTSVHGTVDVRHPSASAFIPAVPEADVFYRDVIETQEKSKTRALFDDDSILTVGEHSRVEITEHVYDPKKNMRRMVVRLMKGSVRALVSKIFTGAGSKFEVHTPSAVAAARGTYFIVWTDGETSGIVNIGHTGRVDFLAGNKAVTVNPREYSTAQNGGAPMVPAVVSSGAPSIVAAVIAGTDLRDVPMSEPAQEAIARTHEGPLTVPPTAAIGAREKRGGKAFGQAQKEAHAKDGSEVSAAAKTQRENASDAGPGRGRGPKSEPPQVPFVVSADEEGSDAAKRQNETIAGQRRGPKSEPPQVPFPVSAQGTIAGGSSSNGQGFGVGGVPPPFSGILPNGRTFPGQANPPATPPPAGGGPPGGGPPGGGPPGGGPPGGGPPGGVPPGRVP